MSFSNSLLSFALMRILSGIAFGGVMTVFPIIVSEFMSMNQRGRGQIITNFALSIGKLAGVVLAMCLIPVPGKGNWQIFALVSSISSIVSLILVGYFVK